MKKLLHLYNYGHNPFPKLGKGGLGYHLPQYRIKGRGGIEQLDGNITDTGPDNGPEIFSKDGTTIIGEAEYDEEYDDDGNVIGYSVSYNMYDPSSKAKMDVEETKKFLDETTYEHFDDDEYDDADEDAEEQRLMNTLSLDGLTKLIDIVQTRYSLNKYIKNWSNLSTDEKRRATEIILKKYDFDQTQKDKLYEIKKIKDPIKRNEDFLDWITTQKIKIKTEEPEDEDALPFEFHDLPTISITDKDIQYIKDTDIPEYTEEYNKAIKTINKMSKSSNIYTEYINDKLSPSSESTSFLNAFSVEHPVIDLTVSIDGKDYKGEGGLDFEAKIEANPELIEYMIQTQLGTDIKVVSIIPDQTGNDKADFYVIVKDKNNKEFTIDLELKKYVAGAATKFNSTEKINEGTSKMFNEWFYDYKRKMNKIYKDCIDKTNFTDYNKMLDAITTNKKIDKQKLLEAHVKSGHYFALPLTLTKPKTPSKEVIIDVMSKKYPDKPKEAVKLANYMHQNKRFNESKNILMTLFLIKDALVVDNVSETFKDKIILEHCKLIDNIYGKKVKNAYGMPAVYMKTLSIPQNLFDISNAYDIEKIKEQRIKEITTKKQIKSTTPTPKKTKPKPKTKPKSKTIII